MAAFPGTPHASISPDTWTEQDFSAGSDIGLADAWQVRFPSTSATPPRYGHAMKRLLALIVFAGLAFVAVKKLRTA